MELNQNLSDFFSSNNNTGSGGSPQPATGGQDLSGFLDQPKPAPAAQKTQPVSQDVIRSIAAQEGAESLLPVIGAIYGQESSGGTNARTSTDGARGGMQIMPDTFRRYARAGERIDSPEDNMRVGVRIIKDLAGKFGNDPARIAAGYFSGEGNVNPGQGSAWRNDRADGNGKRVSGYVADVLKRVGNVVPSAQAATLPDLGKAPKWDDIEANPEFRKLSADDKFKAKAAYFDYWIAPHAGAEGQGLRQQFLQMPLKSDDQVAPIPPEAEKAAFGIYPKAGIRPGDKKPASVLENAPAPGELPTASKVPVRPEVRAAFNAQWDAATPDQRKAMAEQSGWVGMLARERSGVFEQADQVATPTTAKLDPRIEARVQRLVAAGEDPAFAERAAREAAAAGVVPGREIEFMQRRGVAQGSTFDFDTKALFDQAGGPNGLNNPVVRGVAKAGLGIGKAVSGYGQFLSEVYGLEGAAAAAKAGGDWTRGKEQAIGESGTFLERNFEGAISSIGQQLPLLIGGVKAGTQAIPLAGMAVQSFGQEYSDGRAAGQSAQDAATRASIFAAFEVLGEKFGLREQMAAIKAAARGMPSDQIVGFLWSALKKEVPGELLTTTGQFGTDKFAPVGLNPQATGADYLKQVADTIAQTIMQSGVMAGGTTGVSKVVRFMREDGKTTTDADAEYARQQALNKWNTQGLAPRSGPTMAPDAAPVSANVTPDGRIEPTFDAGALPVEPAEQAGAPAINPPASPLVETADNIVRELAEQAGIPEATVLPTPAATPPGVEDVSDQDVLDFAATRYQQLREKRDGSIQTVVGETGIVDQDVPGVGLSPAEQQELAGLERAQNDPQVLRALYGFGAASIPSDQSQFQNQAQVPAPAAGPVEQPEAGQTFPAATEPGLVAAQENQDVQTQALNEGTGPALDQGAVVGDGLASGPAAQQEPAGQAPAAQVGTEAGQRLEGLPAEDALIDDEARLDREAIQNTAPVVEQADDSDIPFDEAPAKPRTEKEARQQKEAKNGTQAPQAQQAEAQGQEAPAANADAVKARYEQIERQKAANREALKNFKKGDQVEYTAPGTYTMPDGSKREGRVVRGTIDKIMDADMGLVTVGNATVGASMLRKVEAAPKPKTEKEAKAKRATPKNTAEIDTSEKRVEETGKSEQVEPMAQGAEAAKAGQPRTPPAGLTDKAAFEWMQGYDGQAGTTAPADQPATDTSKFAGNKLFTEDKVAAARARLRSKLGNMNSGIDPEVLVDGVTLAGAYIEAGVRKYSDYAKAMVEDFGDKIRPYLRSFYEGVRHYPGLDTAGMSTPAEIDLMETQGTAEHMKPAPGTEQAIGQVEKPQRKKEKPAGALTLRDDYGVSSIDGYDSRDERPSGPVKTQFLNDTRKYLQDVAKTLQARGFEPATNRAGKPMKPVNVNESGVATSGDVSLAMFHPDMQRGIYITIGGTSLRGPVPTTTSGVSVMMRVTKAGDPYGGSQNRWMPVNLASTELADLAAQAVEQEATRAAQSSIAQPAAKAENLETPKEAQDGNPQRRDGSTAEGSNAGTEQGGPAAAGDQRTAVDLAGGESEQVQATDRGQQAPADAQEPQAATGAGERVSDRPADAARQPDGKAADGRTAADTVATNFTITDELNFAGQGAKTKYANNIAAIRLLKSLESEGRQATAAEQAVLAKYIGWGGMPQAFDPKNKQWSKEYAELKELLTADEYATAASSTRNAHYTAKPVVEAIWAGLARIGFKNGAVLEPSLGSGNFFGLMPVGARGKSRLFGVEFDHITGGIAKQLYPQAKVNAPIGFQDIKLAPESFDVATGNPPFGDESLYDPSNPEISKFKIHGFFFAKSVETLKPGGVLAMVVSKGLMDANDARGKAARAWLAERTRLLGAIRLPNNAFQENANTEVTTDIIFLQKLTDGVEANTAEWNGMADLTDRESGQPIPVNKYFVANPDMMLGEMTLAGSMYRANEPTLSAREGDNLPDLMAKAIEKLPEGVFQTGKSTFIEAGEKANKVSTADNVREYGYFLQDGKLYQRMPDFNGERQSVPVAREGKELERMVGMIGLRDLVRQQLALEKSATSKDADIEANRAALNKAYDAFVKKYGYLNGQTNKRLFADDSDAALVLSLEAKFDKGVTEAVAKSTGQKPRQPKASKATIFTKRVQTPVAQVTKAGTAKEAMLASLNERGRIDMGYMSGLLGDRNGNKPHDTIVAELGDLVFEDPASGWVPADLYLSGNVKAALTQARAAAEKDARFQRNVAALMKVQPADINPSDIFVKIGSPWVPLSDYAAFVKETFGGKMSGAFLPATGNWSVDVGAGTPTETNTTFGTERMGAHRIIETLMSNKQVAVYDEIRLPDGNTQRVLNAEETAAAQGKADALAEAFQDWIWKDNDRRERLARSYNDTYNTNVPRKYDGSHLTLPGMNTAIQLRPHQLNWVYRSLVEGKGLADHVVGAGKTYAIIAAMMEMRRLGLANKPMIVVPNHLVGQWAKDILALYPGANVLAASRKDFQKDRRKLLFSRIATGDWDMVVVAHSSFGRIPVPAETEQKILDDQLAELTLAIQQAKADKGARFTVKDLERAKTRIEEKLKKLADRSQDDALDFADLGVDALAVDEAHEFKNLFYTTTLQGVAGLGSPQGSTRAFDMFVKTRYVSERAGGKNVFFATGTPLANSIAEVFHMQRFLQYETLKARGIHNFDAWANTFGQSTSDWEMNAAGKFVQKTRFRKFANLPELKGIWGEIADTVSRADLMRDAEAQGKRFPLPKVKGGRPENVVTERSPLQAEFIGIPQQEMDADGKPKLDENGQPVITFKSGTIVYRLENWKVASKTNPKEIPLAITGQARKAGLDYRLIDENAPDFEGSKINAAVSRIFDTWKANDERKGTQLVFCDLSVPASAKGQATADAAAKVPTFFLRVNGGETLLHVAGVPLNLQAAPDFQFFTHKTGKVYQVIERTSGLTVAEGRTKAEAVDAANAKMAKTDLTTFGERVQGRAIASEAIDDYIARWEEQQAQADDTGSDEDSAEGAKEISLDEMLADGGGNFSVYDDIKAKLIAKGMPAEQIAFIHDYNTDEKKAALFAAVNAGEVRVLLGSTQKMGAGTNVQSKLVALHHMDAPWRPADLEQREGRIIRQGNEFYEADPEGFEVAIYRYATKQTYDSRMWEIIETKARAIEQFKTDATLREVEDVSSESANAAEMKAGASGNPLILEEISMRTDLRKLQAMKKSWERSRFDLEKKIKDAENKTGWVYSSAKMADEFAGQVQPKNKDKLGLKVFGLTIDGEKGVNTEELASKMVANADTSEGKKVGSYRGIDLYLRRDSVGVTFFTLHRDHLVSSTTYGQNDKFSVSGFITRMDNLADNAAKWKERTADAVVQFEKDAENAKKELARGFPKEEELRSLNERHKAVVAALRAGKTSLDGEAPGPKIMDIARAPASAFAGVPEPVRVNARQKLNKLEQRLDDGKITEAEYVLAVREITASLNNQRDEREYRRVVAGRRRGAEWIVAQMRRGVADNTVTREAADFAQWLLDQNPDVADGLGISIRSEGERGQAAEYMPLPRIMKLIAGKANVGSAVHEILHHTERMMPKEVQDGVLQAWQRAWDAAYKAATPEVQELMRDMLKASMTGDQKASDRVRDAFGSGTLTYDKHYQLYSPSEFWAVNATRILSGRFQARGSWVSRAVQWFKEFIERVKGVLGLRSDAPVLKALREVMRTDGAMQSEKMLVERSGSSNGAPTFNDITRRAQNNLIQFFGNRDKSLKTFGAYDKTLSTQFNKALKDKHFGKVFGYVNAMQNEVSLTSIRPAELAPGVLPRVDDVKSALATMVKGKKADKNLEHAAQAIFDGTLAGDSVMQGRVWTMAEFMARPGATEQSWALYQQARNAIDASLDELAAAEAYAMAQGFVPKAMRRTIIDNPRQAQALITGEIKKQIKMLDRAIKAAAGMGADQQQAELEAARESYKRTLRQIEKIFVTGKNLKAAGYAPLMRFGKFTVTVQAIDPTTGNVARDENGDSITLFYGQYETEGEAKAVRAEKAALYADRDDVRVKAGTKSQTSHEMYAGISPETLALFAEAIGADTAMRKYIELAMTERSALKRRLERKGTEGFSQDLPRVLSNFITSNGRFAAQRYYLRDLNNAIKYIPKEKGDVLDEAIRLKKFVMNPSDDGAQISSTMFAWFLGGSVAAAVVNLTQPVMMTAPYLSQFGIPVATKAITQALPYAMGRKQITDDELRTALKRAAQEGIVDAQEIFHLYSVGAQGVASNLVNTLAKIPGAGKAIKAGSEDARARVSAFLTLWGSMFALAEGFNRRLTFIAAWEVAQANGERNPYAFAVRAVNETQGIYNKVNRPNWAQNTVGRAILTFKQFSLMYLELLSRMWKRGGPEGKRAALTMLAVLMLASGAEGLPFAQDLDDLIDTVGQMFGLDTNMRRNKRRLAHEILGKTMGDLFLYGVSSKLPLDFSGRLGLGNLIPGTGLLKPSNEQGRGREVAEIFGPTAGMASQIGDAYDAAVEGNAGKALQNLAPKAVKDVLAAVEMTKKGYATDAKGRKVVDVDGTDIAVKSIGFNPTKVAQETRKTMPVQQDIGLQKRTESSIVDQWVRGIVDSDPALVTEAQQRLETWNKRNPDTPIVIKPNQIRDKARQMGIDKDGRLLKQAPREMRGRLGLDLAD